MAGCRREEESSITSIGFGAGTAITFGGKTILNAYIEFGRVGVSILAQRQVFVSADNSEGGKEPQKVGNKDLRISQMSCCD